MHGIAELEEGSVFAGEFRVVRRLASGGMGAVYVAEQIATGRQRALKLMHPGLVGSPELREKFTLEARVGARIASEHVVEVVAAGVDAASGAPWLAMEMLVGKDIAAAVKERGPFTPSETGAVIAQVCHALAAAHKAGVVHRDLKPENVFLAEAKRAQEAYTVKVLDFGIAKVLEAARGSNTGAIGSPLWMAPEQTERNAEISAATDVWALGLVAFYMLTGRSFWMAADQSDMALSAFLRELVLDPIPSASERAAELGLADAVPRSFDAWFARTLCREREGRFQTADEAYAALRDLVGAAPMAAIRSRLEQPLPASGEAAPSGPAGSGDRVRISSGGALTAAASETKAERLGTAQTLAHGPDTPADPHDDHHPVGIPGEARPRWLVAGIVTAAILATGGALFAMRRTDDPRKTPEPQAASAALPYCPKGMVRVPGGELSMGTDSGPSEEQPAHVVKVAPFCIDVTEVTVHEYRECATRKACAGSRGQVEWPAITRDDRETWSAFCNEGKPARDDHPMNCVSFEDAASYCKWAGKRLPTEEQWEYAARGTDGRGYPWGHDGPNAARVNGCDEGCARAARKTTESIAARLHGDDRWEATSPTGAFPEGVGPFGTFDMAGNVAEWVDASYCPYGQSACGTGARVVRGGAWTSDVPTALRTTARVKANPSARLAEVGFRCVR